MTKTRSLGTRRVALLPFVGLSSSMLPRYAGYAAAGGADSIYSEAVTRVRKVLKVLILPALDGADADEVEVSDGDVEDLTAEPKTTIQTLRTPGGATVTVTSSASSGSSGKGGMAKRGNSPKSASDSIRSLNMSGGGLEKWRPKNKSIKTGSQMQLAVVMSLREIWFSYQHSSCDRGLCEVNHHNLHDTSVVCTWERERGGGYLFVQLELKCFVKSRCF